MKNTLEHLKRLYIDWRYWSYIYRNMKTNTEKTQGEKTEPTSALIPYLNKPGIAFSIDDSFRVRDWYEYGKDLFEFYDVKATFNINAFHHYEDRRGHNQKEIDMLIDLQANGHEIAHHGFNHKDVVKHSESVGIKKWIEDDIETLFEWMEQQTHSKTGAKFKKPVTFAFPHFRYNEKTLNELVPKYFKVVRGHLINNYLTDMNHTGIAPSICIDSHYLSNPKNIKNVIKFVKKLGSNLILTCHSILPDEVKWDEFGWPMTEHERRWRTSPKTLQYIINEAKKNDLEFYTTAEIGGVATFIDRNFEKYIRSLLSIPTDQWIFIKQLTSIKELNLRNQNISNLDGIQYFLGLEKLDLSNNKITDFRLLNKLSKLAEVKFRKKEQ